MIDRRVVAAVVGSVVLAAAGSTSAQQQTTQAQTTPKTGKIQERWMPTQPELDVEELTPGQIERAQEPERPIQRGALTPATASPPPKASAKATPATPAEPPTRAVACNGAFAKDSNHLKLATLFNAQNVSFTAVDGPDGSKVMASVLFPKDAKRRIEVWWQNEAERAGTYLIVINGQSAWAAPKGLKLGMPLAAIEKLNGKPFKLNGFGKDGSSVTDWQNGVLAHLPGGCKVGLRLTADPKAPAEARSGATPNKEFSSSDATMRALKPSVAEIILGY